MKLKTKLRYLFVERNKFILKEFSDYVNHTPGNHKMQPYAWWLLLRLNFKYRILRCKMPESYRKQIARTGTSKLPYLEGAESSLHNKLLPFRFAAKLLKNDVISFDIFDTLLLRPFARPTDLFYILEEKLHTTGFVDIRKKAEREARDMALLQKGNHEVTIFDIYELIEQKTGIPKDVGVKVEFETEMEFCFPNPYMQVVYRSLLSQGKKMVATSDMYLPEDMIRQLLDKCGYTGIEEIFVSCDNNCNKRNKGLFYLMIKKVGKKNKIIHIGDNGQTDIKAAQEVGLDAQHYKNVHLAGNQYRADGMSELTFATYAGIVNTTLHNGLDTYSPAWEFGFIYGGLYILGFCNWLHQKAVQNNIDKILFLSRDGSIYKRVFDYLFDDVPNEYMLWSRIVHIRLNADINRIDFINRMVRHKSTSVVQVSIGQMLHFLDLDRLAAYLPAYSLSELMIINPENAKLLEKVFYDHYDEVANNWNDESEKLREIVKEAVGDAKRVAIVDVGWLASGPMAIKDMMHRKWNMDCDVFCYIAGSLNYSDPALPLTNLMKGDVEAYLFSRSYNRNLYDTHVKTNKRTNCIYFELFTQAEHPSFYGVGKDGSYIFDVPEVENYQNVHEIHDGIFAFCKQYTEVFAKYPYLFNITGYDAYLPYRMIIRNLDFIKKNFGAMSFSRTVGGDSETQSLETIEQILSKYKLL